MSGERAQLGEQRAVRGSARAFLFACRLRQRGEIDQSWNSDATVWARSRTDRLDGDAAAEWPAFVSGKNEWKWESLGGVGAGEPWRGVVDSRGVRRAPNAAEC